VLTPAEGFLDSTGSLEAITGAPVPATVASSTESLVPHAEENDESAESSSKSSSADKFSLGGQTLNLPNVSNGDSLYYRIESLRVYLETELGEDKFLKAYRCLKDAEDDSQEDEETEKHLNEILAGKMEYLSLLNQLLFCEDLFDQE
jgi:hypothetical protein